MTITTTEDWVIDGVSMQTLAKNFNSWGGAKQAAPPLRGENQLLGGFPGKVWVPKVADSRVLDFEGWVRGTDDDGLTAPSSALLRQNWMALKKLLYTPRRQVTITKKWRDASNNLITATGLGQFVDPPEPNMVGPQLARFTATCVMADPFFYGDPISTTFNPAGTTQTKGIAFLGDEFTRKITVTFKGDNVQPRITLPGQELRINKSMLATETVVIEVADYRVMRTEPGADITWINYIGSFGYPWLEFEGSTSANVAFTRNSGTNTVDPAVLTYQPAYI